MGGDGIAFVLQRDNTPPPNNTTASPATANSYYGQGEHLGYVGISPSLGIEFDTHQNPGESAFDHIAISRNGDVYDKLSGEVAAKLDAFSNPADIEDGVAHAIKITWDKPSNTLKVYFDGVLRLTYTNDIVASLFGANPANVYWGFTAATSGADNQQGVCDLDMKIINLVPVAVNDIITTNEDNFVTGQVLTNDADRKPGLSSKNYSGHWSG